MIDFIWDLLAGLAFVAVAIVAAISALAVIIIISSRLPKFKLPHWLKTAFNGLWIIAIVVFFLGLAASTGHDIRYG